MYKRFFYFLTLFIGFQYFAQANMPYRVRYPYGLLTKDYGILNETADLGVDTWRGIPHPYREHGFNGGYPYWMCFSTNDISIKHEIWRDSDSMGRSDSIVDLCTLEFVATTDSEIHFFIGRRGYLEETCQSLLNEWKKVTSKQSHVCFNGYDGEAEPRKTYVEIRTIKTWTWDRIKTKKGCMSYFEGYCDLKHWKKERNKTNF